MVEINWNRRDYTEEDFKLAVSECFSWASVLRRLGKVPAGGNYESVKLLAGLLDLDVSHFTGQLWSKGNKSGPNRARLPLSAILVENRLSSSVTLKARLLSEGLIENKCSARHCLLPETMIHPFTGELTEVNLELDHINGVKSDNRIENLRLLCPTCHSYTDTYRGKNINKGVRTKLSYAEKKVKHQNTCGCGKLITRNAVQCVECYNASKKKKIGWPSTQELLDRVKATSYTQVGKELGVSDNAVRKRIKNHPIV